MEKLLSQKGPAYDLMSNEDRIQMERKELAKKDLAKADGTLAIRNFFKIVKRHGI